MKKSLFRFGCVSLAALLVATGAYASSHREAPNVARFPTVDSTDFYMFRSYEQGRSDYVTIIANYIPLQDAYGGPNYFAMDPKAIYEIHIDNDGDAVEDLTYQFKFNNTLAGGNGVALNVGGKSIAVPLKQVGGIAAGDSSKLNAPESYTLTLITGDRRKGSRAVVKNTADNATSFVKPLDYVGSKTFADYSAYANQYINTISVPGCAQTGRVFVGQRKEGFVVNLGKTFDLVNYVPVEGDSAPGAHDGRGFPGGITQSTANNTIAGKNVTSIALELPIACLKGAGNGVIGGWTTASLPQARLLNPTATFSDPETTGGAYTQVSRLGSPLVNELVIGLKDKDKFSASKPKDDGQFADYVTNPSLPALLDILFRGAVNTTLGTNIANLAPTNFPRKDLVAAFLTGFAGVNQQSKVTASEMLRLNTAIPAVAKGAQSTFGVAGNDLAGFPNGRRPGDDVVDIALRVVMGALCYDIPVAGTPTNLGLCAPSDAAVGNVPFTDGAPISDADFDATFPYLKAPIPGSI